MSLDSVIHVEPIDLFLELFHFIISFQVFDLFSYLIIDYNFS